MSFECHLSVTVGRLSANFWKLLETFGNYFSQDHVFIQISIQVISSSLLISKRRPNNSLNSDKNHVKYDVNSLNSDSLEHFGATWGTLWDTFGSLWGSLGSLGGTLGSLGSHFGALWVHLDALWGHLGVTLGDFGVT